MKKLVIFSFSLLLMGTAFAQPKKGKQAKQDTIPAKVNDPRKFEDSIVFRLDTAKVRIATYEKDGKYIGFTNGYVVNKKYYLFNTQAELENVTYFFTDKWVAVKPVDVFDAKQYKW